MRLGRGGLWSLVLLHQQLFKIVDVVVVVDAVERCVNVRARIHDDIRGASQGGMMNDDR